MNLCWVCQVPVRWDCFRLGLTVFPESCRRAGTREAGVGAQRGQEVTRFPSKNPRSRGAACQKVMGSQLMLSGFTQHFGWEMVIFWSF